MQNKSAQQIAEEKIKDILALQWFWFTVNPQTNLDDSELKSLAKESYFKDSICQQFVDATTHLLMREFYLTQLIEDKMMLDWLEHRDVTYFFSEFACRADNLRQAIMSAMKKEQDK